jgi:hypothetical protein
MYQCILIKSNEVLIKSHEVDGKHILYPIKFMLKSSSRAKSDKTSL